jgi:FMN phosphatase YigB (HAD superfamily)
MKTILVDAVNTLVIKEVGVFVAMQKMLDEFPNPKIILTNASEEEKKNYALIDMPYELFSLAHNPDKTDPMYYKTFLERFELSTEDVIYFEHNEEAVKSAQSVGITTYHYDKDKKDLDSLKAFLEENL